MLCVIFSGRFGKGVLVTKSLSVILQVRSCGVPEANITAMSDSDENVGTELWPNAANLKAKLIECSKKVEADGMSRKQPGA